MDPLKFDRFARALGATGSRRSVIAALLSGGLIPLLTHSAEADPDRGAKHNRRVHRHDAHGEDAPKAPASARKACKGGKTRCGKRCIDTQTNRKHCGSCDHVCQKTGPGTGVCQGGLCRCPRGIACEETCCEQQVCQITACVGSGCARIVANDGTACPGGVCCRGQCESGTCCTDAQCVTPAAPICNAQHTCVACSTDDQCVEAGKGARCCEGKCFAAGQCCAAADCPTPTCRTAICRANRCLYRQAQDGSRCQGSGQCRDGRCVCPRGTFDCGDGTCRQCCCPQPGPSTCSPICQDEGEICCGFSCVDTNSDPNNCGGCGQACLPGEGCDGGQCGCRPQCQGKVCGPNRCGGSCGECPDRLVCNQAGTACVCRTTAHCPAPPVCQEATCTGGVCGVRNVANGAACTTAQGSGMCCGGACRMRAGACSGPGNASCPPDKPTCDSGVCHNRYGCTAAQDVCSGRGAQHCPNNAKGYCVGANGGQFCHTEDVPRCLFPGQTCCDCPFGYDCVTLNGPGCCFGQGSLVCLKPVPPP